MKRKNRLKNKIHTCFFCGKELPDLKHKIVHRLNTKKENKEFNILIVCEHCKQRLLNKEITVLDIHTEYLDKYFQEFSKDCRYMILKKVYKYIINNS